MEQQVMEDLSVEQVYDLASEIGKEFEKMINSYGVEAVTDLMPKVISALEHLEASAIRSDCFENQIADLKSSVAQLEYEKTEKAEYRNKFEQELEQIEDLWRKETNQLSDLVTRLQEENRRLNSSLAEKDDCLSQKCRGCISEQDLKLIRQLKEVIDKQRSQLKSKDEELQSKGHDTDVQRQQIDHFAQINRDLRRRYKHGQIQLRLLVEDKADLQVQLQEQQRELQILQSRLGTAMKENIDLATTETTLCPELRGKLVIDLDDPNRPRFTIDELKSIMLERNDLKARISELEDELAVYKPQSTTGGATASSSQTGGEDSSSPEDDPPVQGPINREPDEKLFPMAKLSGIRRFFRFLLGSSRTAPTESTPIPLLPFTAFPPSLGPT